MWRYSGKEEGVMKKSLFWMALIVICTVIGMSQAVPVCAEVNMSEGKWETTMEMTMEGMPFKMPPTKSTQCITRENAVPKASEKESNCKIIDQKITGNTVSWKVKCVEKDMTTEGEGEITYSGASYSGAMLTRMTDKSGKIQSVKMKLAGKRVGECSEADKKDKDKYKTQLDQAKTAQHGLEEKTRRAEELAKLTVPDAGPGACLLSNPAGCEAQFGKLNLQEGQWEMSEEGTSTVKESASPKVTKGKSSRKESSKPFYAPASLSTSTKCLSDKEALSYTQEQGCVKENKRSSDRVTWSAQCTYSGTTTEEKGAITYSGTSYDGVKIRKMSTQGGETTTITKLSGRRTGDGNCIRAAVQRDSTSKKRGQSQEQKSVDAEGEKSPNPVKTFKKLFGL